MVDIIIDLSFLLVGVILQFWAMDVTEKASHKYILGDFLMLISSIGLAKYCVVDNSTMTLGGYAYLSVSAFAIPVLIRQIVRFVKVFFLKRNNNPNDSHG